MMRPYLLIIGTAVLLAAGTYILSFAQPIPWANHYLVNIVFLVFLTFITDRINQQALQQEGQGVIVPYLVSIVLKLIFSAIFLVFFIKANTAMVREIIFSFLTYYAIFSAVEIAIVNKRLRLKKF